MSDYEKGRHDELVRIIRLLTAQTNFDGVICNQSDQPADLKWILDYISNPEFKDFGKAITHANLDELGNKGLSIRLQALWLGKTV